MTVHSCVQMPLLLRRLSLLSGREVMRRHRLGEHSYGVFDPFFVRQLLLVFGPAQARVVWVTLLNTYNLRADQMCNVRRVWGGLLDLTHEYAQVPKCHEHVEVIQMFNVNVPLVDRWSWARMLCHAHAVYRGEMSASRVRTVMATALEDRESLFSRIAQGNVEYGEYVRRLTFGRPA